MYYVMNISVIESLSGTGIGDDMSGKRGNKWFWNHFTDYNLTRKTARRLLYADY